MAPRPHTVAAVITHGVSPFELSVACEVFGLDRSELVDPWYRRMVCSLVDEPVRTKSGGGMTVNAPYRLADVEQADTIVIPMWHGDDPPSAEVVDALRAAHRSEEHTSELQSLMRTSYAVFFSTKTNRTT